MCEIYEKEKENNRIGQRRWDGHEIDTREIETDYGTRTEW